MLALQQAAGNQAVAALCRSRLSGITPVQRLPEDVHTFIHRINTEPRAGKVYGNDVFKIVRDMKAFSDGQRDEETRAELVKRAKALLDHWTSDASLGQQRDRVFKLLHAIVSGPQAATPKQEAQAPAPPPPTSTTASTPQPVVPVLAAAPAKVTITNTMRASTVLGYIAGGMAIMPTLEAKWFVSGPDRDRGKDCYSTAYRMGPGCVWEIHCHRDAKHRTWTATVQNTASVGNTHATRGMPLDDADKKLEPLGVPKLHYPNSPYNQWRTLF